LFEQDRRPRGILIGAGTGVGLVEFNKRPENAIPDFPFDDEAKQERVSKQLAEIENSKREYMRQKIRERQK
jgi:hypothetical protein